MLPEDAGIKFSPIQAGKCRDKVNILGEQFLMAGMLFFFFVVVFLPCFSLFALLAIVLKGTEQQFLLKLEFGDNN